MKNTTSNRNAPTNPPLRIFSAQKLELAVESASPRFHRPKLQNVALRDRIAQYFTKRGFSQRSPLD